MIALGASAALGCAHGATVPGEHGVITSTAVKSRRGPRTSDTLIPFEERSKSLFRNCAEFCVSLEGDFFFDQ